MSRCAHFYFLVPTVDLAQDNFYMNLRTIRLGANIPDAGEPPYFLGHMRNFRVTLDPNEPNVFDGKPPFVGERR